MEEIEQSQISDASPESSSEAPQADNSQAEGGDKSQAATQKTDVPFHEHPRWKEVINERNQFASKLQEMERRLEDDRRQRETRREPATPTQNKLIERLKGIDPEFASWAEQQEQAKASVAQLTQELQQFRAQADRDQAQTALEQLHSQNKVPAELQGYYKAAIREMASQDPRLGVKDLPQIYKTVHENMQKYLDGYKRQALDEYAKGKKQDSVPSAPRGQAPKPGAPKTKFTGDPEADRDLVVKQTMQNLRAQRNA